MSIAPNTARLFVLTARKSDLEYRLTTMMNTTQRLAQENADILEQKSKTVQNYLSALSTVSTTGQDAAPAIAVENLPEMVDFDTQLKNLEIAQNKLDLDQKKLETEHQAVVAEEDGVQKQVDNSIKNELSPFKD